MRRDVPIGAVLTYDDVVLPEDRLIDRLRAEQNALFGAAYRPAPRRCTAAQQSTASGAAVR
jgi:hypothetical protein